MQKKIDFIKENYPDALLVDGFDVAIIGVAHRAGQEPVVSYDRKKVIAVLTQSMTKEEAEEFFEFNIIGSYMGEYTPVFVDRF